MSTHIPYMVYGSFSHTMLYHMGYIKHIIQLLTKVRCNSTIHKQFQKVVALVLDRHVLKNESTKA